jgi:hypothetical protein
LASVILSRANCSGSDSCISVDIDLDTLKQEIVAYLDASPFAVFRSHPGGLEGLPLVCWDCERFPDYRMFLDTAQKMNVQLILLAAREFEHTEIDEETEELEACELPRDETRALEIRLAKFRKHEGQTCALELAFDYNSRMYVYEVHPDWYEEFLELSEEITELQETSEPEDEEDGGMGGFYSNN